MQKAKQLIGYYRVSTRKQGAQGLGADAQRSAVRAFVQREGGQLAGEYAEVESGKRDDRPELAKALAACRVRGAVLVVSKLDRLARRALTILRLIEESGVEFVALDYPQASKLTITIFAAIAEHEAALISQRTKAALAEAKRRGAVLGGHVGRIDEAAQRRGSAAGAVTRTERADKFAADMGPIIKDLCPHATSAKAIAACLNAHGWPAPRGGEWSHVQVRRVLARLAV